MAIPAKNILGNPNVTEGSFQIAIEQLRESVIGSGKTYDSANTYMTNDTCVYGGIIYYSKIDSNTGNTPVIGENWGDIADLIGDVVQKSGDTMTGNLNFSGTGLRITGDFSNATASNKTAIQTNILNSSTVLPIFPNGNSTKAGVEMFSSTDIGSTRVLILYTDNTESRIESSAYGVSTVPMTFFTGGTEKVRIDTAGNALVTGAGGLGYGTGSGGTVTQLTSKATAVTLNKPTGKIIMNNASLASNGVVTFQFFNSSINIKDTVTVNTVAATYVSLNSYDVKVEAVALGYCYITVRNNTGGPLSDALCIQFNVIKGSIN